MSLIKISEDIIGLRFVIIRSLQLPNAEREPTDDCSNNSSKQDDSRPAQIALAAILIALFYTATFDGFVKSLSGDFLSISTFGLSILFIYLTAAWTFAAFTNYFTEKNPRNIIILVENYVFSSFIVIVVYAVLRTLYGKDDFHTEIHDWLYNASFIGQILLFSLAIYYFLWWSVRWLGVMNIDKEKIILKWFHHTQVLFFLIFTILGIFFPNYFLE